MRQRLLLPVVVVAVALAALGVSLGLKAYAYAQRRVALLEAELQQVNAKLEETRKQIDESHALAAQLQQKVAGITVERDALVRRRMEADRQIAALQEQLTRLRQNRPASPARPGERR